MEEELFNPFNKIFLAFKVFGMWQDGRLSWTYFILGYLNHIIGMELCLLGEIIRAYKDTGFEDFIETAGIILTYTSGVLKSINFVYKLKIIQKTFDALRELVKFTADDRWKNREQLKARISFGFRVYKVIWASAWISCLSAAFVPFTSHKLPYKVWFPFDTETIVGFWTASVYLILTSFITSAIDMSLDTLPVFFLVFAIGLTDELTERLEEIGKDEKLNNAAELKKCVLIHTKISELVQEVQKIFSTVILAQGFLSSLILCVGAFSISTVTTCHVSFYELSNA
jgi:hypothetical protein